MKKLLVAALLSLLSFPAYSQLESSHVKACGCGEEEALKMVDEGKFGLYTFGFHSPVFDGTARLLEEKGIKIIGFSDIALPKLICFNNLMLPKIKEVYGKDFFSKLEEEAKSKYPFRKAHPRETLNMFYIDLSNDFRNDFSRPVFGSVLLYLSVEANGKVSKVTVVEGLEDEVNEYVVEYARFLPDFHPAVNNGKAIKSYYYLSVSLSGRCYEAIPYISVPTRDFSIVSLESAGPKPTRIPDNN